MATGGARPGAGRKRLAPGQSKARKKVAFRLNAEEEHIVKFVVQYIKYDPGSIPILKAMIAPKSEAPPE